MTVKQKAARAKFTKAISEAKKLRSKNPKLTQAAAVKQAFAILYGKQKPKKVGAVKKKAAPKKKAALKKANSVHKDSKSHNVNIRVVSGVNNDVTRSINAYKKLENDIKIAQKNYDLAKDFTNRFYAKQKLDKLKYELRERKFVLTNLSKELKKIK